MSCNVSKIVVCQSLKHIKKIRRTGLEAGFGNLMIEVTTSPIFTFLVEPGLKFHAFDCLQRTTVHERMESNNFVFLTQLVMNFEVFWKNVSNSSNFSKVPSKTGVVLEKEFGCRPDEDSVEFSMKFALLLLLAGC